MGPVSALHTPGICDEKARLLGSYKEAEAAFDTARTAIRQRVGRSSKDEYFTLARAADLAWDSLQGATLLSWPMTTRKRLSDDSVHGAAKCGLRARLS